MARSTGTFISGSHAALLRDERAVLRLATQRMTAVGKLPGHRSQFPCSGADI